MQIYTKFGDRGATRLFDGTIVEKDDPRVEAYGEVDELNAGIGMVLAFLEDQEVGSVLRDVQRQLFAVGAQMANPRSEEGTSSKARLAPEWVSELESAIDTYEAQLPPLRKFILPGGGPSGALLHLARTTCRRAERRVVRLSRDKTVEPSVVQYLNRLSDLLFVLARVVNYRERMEEVQW